MKILIIFGTRPECIKLIPIIKELEKNKINFDILHTNQHNNLFDDLLIDYNIKVTYRLDLINNFTNLKDYENQMIKVINNRINSNDYNIIIVQGDTLSAYVGALYGFNNKLKVYHIEAGMRTYDMNNPYPEEGYRVNISKMTTKYFCPSIHEYNNLVNEGYNKKDLYIVGNTFVDYRLSNNIKTNIIKKQILITIHRRENIIHLDNIIFNIKSLAKKYKDYIWLIPLHPNPILTNKFKHLLNNINNIKLTSPLSPNLFYKELLESSVVITDSGGVQEEVILNSKKAIIIREKTERKSDFDFIKLVSPKSDFTYIFTELLKLNIKKEYNYYYGDGTTAKKIIDIIRSDLN